MQFTRAASRSRPCVGVCADIRCWGVGTKRSGPAARELQAMHKTVQLTNPVSRKRQRNARSVFEKQETVQ